MHYRHRSSLTAENQTTFYTTCIHLTFNMIKNSFPVKIDENAQNFFMYIYLLQ